MGKVASAEDATGIAAAVVGRRGNDSDSHKQDEERIDEEQHLLDNAEELQDDVGDDTLHAEPGKIECEGEAMRNCSVASNQAELSVLASKSCDEEVARQAPSIVPALDLCASRYGIPSPTSMEGGLLRMGAARKTKVSPRLGSRASKLDGLDLQDPSGLWRREAPSASIRSPGKLSSCPEFEVDKHSNSQTSPARDQPPVHLATSSGSLRRRRSASTEPAHERLRSFPQPQASMEESVPLEDTLNQCERELSSLECRLFDLAPKDQKVELDQQGGDCQDLDPTSCSQAAPSTPGSSSSTTLASLAVWRTDCQQVLRHFEGLAADALQKGCDRSTPGAMDVFEQANNGVERLAGLLHQCTDAETEATAPAFCDAFEWRLVTSDAAGQAEQDALRDLIDQLQDLRHDLPCGVLQPATLLRFLRAQRGDTNRAAEMFRASVEWRTSSGMLQRLTDWEAEMATGSTWRARLVDRYRVHCKLGTDRLGMPVMLFRWSMFDAAGLERELGAELMLDIIIGIHEQLTAAMRSTMRERGALAPGALYIWDVGNYGKHGVPNYFSRMWALVRFLPKVARLLEANYPEVVRKVMVIRCGPATKAIHRAAAPFMPAGTLAKCRLYGWRAEEWRQDLEEEMPGSCLPPFLLRDDEVAIASAEPRGGLCPVGAAASF